VRQVSGPPRPPAWAGLLWNACRAFARVGRAPCLAAGRNAGPREQKTPREVQDASAQILLVRRDGCRKTRSKHLFLDKERPAQPGQVRQSAHAVGSRLTIQQPAGRYCISVCEFRLPGLQRLGVGDKLVERFDGAVFTSPGLGLEFEKLIPASLELLDRPGIDASMKQGDRAGPDGDAAGQWQDVIGTRRVALPLHHHVEPLSLKDFGDVQGCADVAALAIQDQFACGGLKLGANAGRHCIVDLARNGEHSVRPLLASQLVRRAVCAEGENRRGCTPAEQ